MSRSKKRRLGLESQCNCHLCSQKQDFQEVSLESQECMGELLTTHTHLIPHVIQLVQEYLRWPIAYATKSNPHGLFGLNLLISSERKSRQWYDIQTETIESEIEYGDPFSLREFLLCFRFMAVHFLHQQDILSILDTPIVPPIKVSYHPYSSPVPASTYRDIFNEIGCKSSPIYGIPNGSCHPDMACPLINGHPDSLCLGAKRKEGNLVHFWYSR